MFEFCSKKHETPNHEKNVPPEWKNTLNGYKKSSKVQSSICTQWKIKKITFCIHAKSPKWTWITVNQEWWKLIKTSKTKVNFCADSVVLCCKSGSALYHHNKLSGLTEIPQGGREKHTGEGGERHLGVSEKLTRVMEKPKILGQTEGQTHRQRFI